MSKKQRSRKQDRLNGQAGAAPVTLDAPAVQDHSPQVAQRDKLKWELSIRGRTDLTARQQELIDLILDKKTKVLFLQGPAGSSKTWLAVYCGLKLLAARRASHITYIRTVVESASKSLGYLPGEFESKMEPYLMPLMDKLDEFVPVDQSKRLLTEKRVIGVPVNYLRGASLNAQVILVDEAQNLDTKELITVLTRLGQYSKLIIVGDPGQSDINGRSGFVPLFKLFDDAESRAEGIHCQSLTKADIVRSGVLRFIVDKLEQRPKA